jgi:hypothetical protein
MQTIVKLILVLLPITVSAQINYLKHYSDSGYDYGEGVVQLDDSSYAICGSSSSFQNGASQSFLLKVDSLGNRIWSMNYGGTESESARRVMHLNNFGYALAGYTNSSGYGNYDFHLIKTDENGQMEWERTYGSAGWDRVNDAAMTRDTGFVLIGETNFDLNNGNDIYIVRTNSIGDTIWTKTIGGAGDDAANAIERYNDSLFVVAGEMYITDSLKTKPYLLYLKDDGSVLFEDTLMYAGSFELNDIIIVNDTLQAIGSHKMELGDEWNWTIYLFNMQSNSIPLIGFYSGGNPGDYHGDLVTDYGSGAYRYVGFSHENHPMAFEIGLDFMVGQMNSSLTAWLQDACHVNRPKTDYGNQMISTSDGGAAVVGYREDIGIGGSSVFLLKIGRNEMYPITDAVFSYDPIVKTLELDLKSEFSVYPNPASSIVNVTLDDLEKYNLVVRDMNGKMVLSMVVSGQAVIDVSNLTSGVYTVEVLYNNRRTLKRIVIE